MSKNIPQEEIIVMPAIVWAESLIGVRMAKTALKASQRRARLEAMRSVIEIHPFTPEIAEHYADIFYELSSMGKMIPQNDMVVAATARYLNFGVLVGNNDESFSAVDGLTVIIFVAIAT